MRAGRRTTIPTRANTDGTVTSGFHTRLPDGVSLHRVQNRVPGSKIQENLITQLKVKYYSHALAAYLIQHSWYWFLDIHWGRPLSRLRQNDCQYIQEEPNMSPCKWHALCRVHFIILSLLKLARNYITYSTSIICLNILLQLASHKAWLQGNFFSVEPNIPKLDAKSFHDEYKCFDSSRCSE